VITAGVFLSFLPMFPQGESLRGIYEAVFYAYKPVVYGIEAIKVGQPTPINALLFDFLNWKTLMHSRFFKQCATFLIMAGKRQITLNKLGLKCAA
jgi:hypothetical protein